MLRSALVLLVVAACSGGPQRVGSAPSWRPSGSAGGGELKAVAAAPVVFAPAAPGEAMYNKPAPAPKASPLGDAVAAAIAEAAQAAGVDAPAADARLVKVCEELAQIVPEQGVVAYRVVQFTMQRNGIIEPSPHLLVLWGDLGNPQGIVDQLRPRFADMLSKNLAMRLGVGAAVRGPDNTGAVVFALQATSIMTNPIPRSLPEDGSFRLDGAVSRPYRDPEVLVTSEDGKTRRLPLAKGRKPGAFSTNLTCQGQSGRQQIEINGSDATGSTVLANFPVWCGETPPTSILVEAQQEDPAPASAQDAELRLLALVNRDRRKAGLAELTWDDGVAKVARGYSEEMKRTRVVAHISPTSGSATDRVKAARINTQLVLENVARAYGVAEAHAGLMDSPGHHQNLMSPLATHIGIGVALGNLVSGRPEMFVTQVFTRVNQRIDERETATKLHQMLSGNRTIPRAAMLDRIAQRVAEHMASGAPMERAWDPVEADLRAATKSYRLQTAITAAQDISMVDVSKLLEGANVEELGIGIAQGPHPDLGEGATWIVLLLGEKPKPPVRPKK